MFRIRIVIGFYFFNFRSWFGKLDIFIVVFWNNWR